MTVEIRELVIQARATSEKEPPTALPPPRPLPDEEWVEIIARRVLEHLREQGWRAP